MRSFNDLAWTELDDTKRGVIAGGLENGSLDLWNADKLLAGSRYVQRCPYKSKGRSDGLNTVIV